MWNWPFTAALKVFSVLKSDHLILTFAVNLLLASFSSPADLVMLQWSLQRPPGKLHYRWATWLCICQTPLLCRLCVLFGISEDKITGFFFLFLMAAIKVPDRFQSSCAYTSKTNNGLRIFNIHISFLCSSDTLLCLSRHPIALPADLCICFQL